MCRRVTSDFRYGSEPDEAMCAKKVRSTPTSGQRLRRAWVSVKCHYGHSALEPQEASLSGDNISNSKSKSKSAAAYRAAECASEGEKAELEKTVVVSRAADVD